MPEDNAALTLDSAIGLLISTEDTNKPAAPAEAAPAAPETPAVAEATPAATETPASETPADPNTPADQGETNEDAQDPGDALPPIEPPSSWSTEEKAEWASLSRKAQEVILRREQDTTKALRTAQNSTAESNKKVEAEVTRLKTLAEQIDGHLNEKVNDLAREFPEVKNEADLVALAASDPARAQLFQAKLQALSAANNAKVQAQQEMQRKSQEAQQAHLAEAKEKLLEAFPAWKEPEVARREVTELQDYAIKMGAPEAMARATTDPVIYKLAQKAMLYDRAQAAKQAAVVRTPPKVLKPGAATADPNKTAKDESRRSQLAKLNTSGDIEDALGLLRA